MPSNYNIKYPNNFYVFCCVDTGKTTHLFALDGCIMVHHVNKGNSTMVDTTQQIGIVRSKWKFRKALKDFWICFNLREMYGDNKESQHLIWFRTGLHQIYRK